LGCFAVLPTSIVVAQPVEAASITREGTFELYLEKLEDYPDGMVRMVEV
jgi:hypothetical protein